MQSRATEVGSDLDGMACEVGERTNPLETIPNRRNRASGQTQTQQRQPITQNNDNAGWLKETDSITNQ